MSSLTPTFRRTFIVAIASAAIALSTVSCSTPPSASGNGDSHAHTGSKTGDSANKASDGKSGDDGSSGSDSGAFCSDAAGDGFGFDSDDDDPMSPEFAMFIKTWDTLAAEAPSEISDDVKGVDEAFHKIRLGDASAATSAKFATEIGNVATWVAANCNV
jgi:hypothetical protein